jgi:hypothetical protein
MATATGDPIWSLNIDTEGSPNEELYQNLIKKHFDLITELGKVLIGYAHEQDRRSLLFVALMTQEAINQACHVLEMADEATNESS